MPAKVEDLSDFDEEPDTTIDPYEVLAISQDATDEEIKKAYRKAALQYHPDKATDQDPAEAKEAFQRIAFAYAILSDPHRKRLYDTTGSTSEVLAQDEDFDWADFYREAYQDAVTQDSINGFRDTYKGSDEERRDLLAAYERCKGNMDQIYQSVMLSNVLDDDGRFRSIIDQAIGDGEVEPYDKYTKETETQKKRRVKNAEREAAEAEKRFSEMADKERKKEGKSKSNKGDVGDLMAIIQQRQKNRGAAFLDSLEERYAAKPTKSKKRSKKEAAADEPPEEAFETTSKRTKKGRN